MSAPGSIHAARCTCSICRPIDDPKAILRAQFDLDHYPQDSIYWDSRAGQESLGVIVDNDLTAATTAEFCRNWEREQMLAAGVQP